MTVTNYSETYPGVIATAAGQRSPRHVMIDTSIYVQRVFPSGLFVGTHSVSGYYRFLPRTKLISNAASGQAVLAVKAGTAGLFQVGEALTQINASTGAAGTAVGTIASINYDASTITLGSNLASQINAGVIVGIATSTPVDSTGNKIGMASVGQEINLDYMKSLSNGFACWHAVTVHRSRLPHIDTQLEGLFPEIITV